MVPDTFCLTQARILAESGENVFPPDLALNGMPHVLEWREDAELESALRSRIEDLLYIPVDRKFDPLTDISPNFGDAEEANRFEQDARKAYEYANQYLHSGDIGTAEELLFECYALCCLANEVGGRASASLEIGRLLLLRRRDSRAALIPLE